MTEINTFSALIDDAVVRTGRPANRADLISFARQSLRECQSLLKAAADLVEDTLIADANPYLWTIPENFRELLAIRYSSIVDDRGQMVYPKHLQPGKSQLEYEYYWYRTGTSMAFAGVEANVTIDVAYLLYSKKLPYYAIADRPATFSLETNSWSYLSATTLPDQQVARDLVTNWILFDWYDLVLEGTCAKLWKIVADPRAGSSFALFKSIQGDFITAVGPDSYTGVAGDGR